MGRGSDSLNVCESITTCWFDGTILSMTSVFFVWCLVEMLFSIIRLILSIFFVSITLLILPCSSAVVGSSGENFHSPSTINLYWYTPLGSRLMNSSKLEVLIFYQNDIKFISDFL